MAAVMAGMIIQSTPVSFGALGTPILVGVNTGLGGGNDPALLEYAAQLGYSDWADFLALVAFRVATLHAIAGTLIPLILVSFMTKFFGKNKTFTEGLRIWPFALFAAFSMTIPYLCAAYFLGPEFPALVGSSIGLLVVVAAARSGFLMPKDSTWDFDHENRWPAEWTGSVAVRDVSPAGGKELGRAGRTVRDAESVPQGARPVRGPGASYAGLVPLPIDVNRAPSPRAGWSRELTSD